MSAETPPPNPRLEGAEELVRVKQPLDPKALRAFSRWVRLAYGELVMVHGDDQWITVYRPPGL